MSVEDKAIENLILLDGEVIVINEDFGLWVKFEVKEVVKSKHRPHGIKYSLTLHDRDNNRILGFDNAHAIESSRKGAKEEVYDHYHCDNKGKAKRYQFVTAYKLIEDFWSEVDKAEKTYKGAK